MFKELYLHYMLIPRSCIIPGILEAEVLFTGPPLGLPGLPGRRRATKAPVRGESASETEESDNWSPGTLVS